MARASSALKDLTYIAGNRLDGIFRAAPIFDEKASKSGPEGIFLIDFDYFLMFSCPLWVQLFPGIPEIPKINKFDYFSTFSIGCRKCSKWYFSVHVEHVPKYLI